MQKIYLDYQATTPCDPLVLEAMMPYFCKEFGNPHSNSHQFGCEARSAVEKARSQVADIIGAKSEEIIFTSGATESNNLAIKGAARFYKSKGNRIITSKIEHKCVLESCKSLEREGFDVVFIDVLPNGLLDMKQLQQAINKDTILVSIMIANNEIGVLQDVNAISSLCKSKNPKIIFHTDAAQAVGKIDMHKIDLNNIDLMSISGHKIYGPKGIGALYYKSKPRVRLVPVFDGGDQEHGMRPGTLATPLCVGLGEACRISQTLLAEESQRILQLRNYLFQKITDTIPKVKLNGDLEHRIPGNLNISFWGVEGEGIMMGLGEDIAISSGSACTSETLEPSYVLAALNVDDELAHSSLRIGIGRYTTKNELDIFADKLAKTVTRLRSMSPLWEE